MPLTPADVHNVAFKKPPIGKRGYDEEEVDAFLDEVERELARLIEENNELRAQVERGGRGGAPAGPGGDPRLAAELDDAQGPARPGAAGEGRRRAGRPRDAGRAGAGPRARAAAGDRRRRRAAGAAGADDGPAHRRRPRRPTPAARPTSCSPRPGPRPRR